MTRIALKGIYEIDNFLLRKSLRAFVGEEVVDVSVSGGDAVFYPARPDGIVDGIDDFLKLRLPRSPSPQQFMMTSVHHHHQATAS